MVLLEKTDEDHGGKSTGSTTVTAYIFHKINDLGLDTPDLMDFVLANKSSNPYTPFGSLTYSECRNYEHYKEILERENRRRKEHFKREKNSIERKKTLKSKKSNNHKRRLEISIKENIKKYELVNMYFNESTNNLLQDIIEQKLPFPLFLIPPSETQKLTHQITSLDANLLRKCLNAIPRKSPVHLRDLRNKIINHKKLRVV